MYRIQIFKIRPEPQPDNAPLLCMLMMCMKLLNLCTNDPCRCSVMYNVCLNAVASLGGGLPRVTPSGGDTRMNKKIVPEFLERTLYKQKKCHYYGDGDD